MTPPPFSIAVLGLGPRGLSVLERLILGLRRRPPASAVVIWAVDPVEHGPGRVWRTSQPGWLTMNATASEVTVQSPDSPLSGPASTALHSLDRWTASPAYSGSAFRPVAYPPRRVYGEYLREVFGRLCAGAPPGVEVRPVLAEATNLTPAGRGMWLTLGDDVARLRVDKVVLATGHGRLAPTPEQRGLRQFAAEHRGCVYVGEDVAADMPLDDVPPGATVAVRGMGLTFYDVVRALSLGRGGRFTRDTGGRLRYRPSGREPRLVAGSRGGLPFRARARITGPPETAPHPVVLTEHRLGAIRADALARRGSPQLDFAREVEPLVHAEVERAYDACAARLRTDTAPVPGLEALGRPFENRVFPGPSAFRARLLEILRADVSESRKGAQGSPLKAGLEVLRQIRPVLPSVVDFGGLLPASHEDFLRRFEPLSYVLSAGPPDSHVEQLVALVEAGVVDVVGPHARFTSDHAAGCFVVSSPGVAGSGRAASAMIEARVPRTDIHRSTSPLTRRMLARGMISEYVNVDPRTGERFATGGLWVTPAPFQVVDARGAPNPDVYAIGVAVDGTRWFTQVGTGRPGRESPFCGDADAIARDILEAARTRRAAPDREVVFGPAPSAHLAS